MRRMLAILALGPLLMVGAPMPVARACSCAMLEPASALEEADAAFVGRLVERPTDYNGPDGTTAIWIFEVEEWVKGDLGPTVGVHSGLGGADCGFSMAEGDMTGVFLYNAEGRPSGGLCSVTSPDALRAATRPLVFDGVGDPVLLFSGQSGRTRLMAVDASGRLLAAAGDERWGWSVDVCPGEEMLVEVVEGRAAVRAVADLEEVRPLPHPGDATEELSQVWCLDSEAERIVGLVNDLDDQTTRLIDLDQPAQPLVSLPTQQVHTLRVGTSHAAVVAGSNPTSIQLVDLTAENRIALPVAPEFSNLWFSPNGSHLAVTSTRHFENGWEASVAVYDLSGRLTFRSEPIPNGDGYGWLDDGRLVVGTYPLDADAPIFASLDVETGATAPLDAPGWEFHSVAGGTISLEGDTVWFTPSQGQSTQLTRLPSESHSLVGVLDDEAIISPVETTTSNSGAVAEEPAVAAPEPPSRSFPTWAGVGAAAGVSLILLTGWAVIRRRNLT